MTEQPEVEAAEVEAPEAPEAPVESEESAPEEVPQGDSPPSPPSEGVDIFGEDAPEAIRQYDDREEDFSIPAEELEGLPPAAMHALSNFRRAFHRKTQSLADERKAMEEREETIKVLQGELQRGAEELAENRLKVLALFQDPRLQEFAKVPEGPEPDPYSPEGMDYRQRKFFAEQMQQFLGQWQAIGQEEQQRVQQTRQALARDARLKEIHAFADSHDDFEQLLPTIRQLRAETNKALPLERAYEIAKAMEASKADKTKQARARARKTVARPPMAGRRSSDLHPPESVQRKGGAAVNAWYDKHPEARAELFRRIQAGENV